MREWSLVYPPLVNGAGGVAELAAPTGKQVKQAVAQLSTQQTTLVLRCNTINMDINHYDMVICSGRINICPVIIQNSVPLSIVLYSSQNY